MHDTACLGLLLLASFSLSEASHMQLAVTAGAVYTAGGYQGGALKATAVLLSQAAKINFTYIVQIGPRYKGG